MFKAIILRVVLLLVGWVIASAIVGFIPILVGSPAPEGLTLFHDLKYGFEACVVGLIYRIGAQLLHFPVPRGAMLVGVRVMWCSFASFLVDASVAVEIGRRSHAAMLAALSLFIVLYLLLERRDASTRHQFRTTHPASTDMFKT